VELVRSVDCTQLMFRLPLNIEFDNGSVQTVSLRCGLYVHSLPRVAWTVCLCVLLRSVV